MRIIWTRDGLDDLRSVSDYVRKRNPSGARRVSRCIREVARLIGQFPLIGEATQHPAPPRTPTSPCPYMVFYEVRADAVCIIALRHTAPDPASMPDAD